MLIPGDATIVTNYMTVSGMGLVNNYLGIMILYFVSAANIFLMRQNFKTIPKELKEAADIDGCSAFGFYWRILLPIAKPVRPPCSLFLRQHLEYVPLAYDHHHAQ